MDITLIGNYPNDENESMNRYAEMLRYLMGELGFHVEIIRPEPIFGRIRRGSQGLGKWLGYIDKYILFPIALRRYLNRRRTTGAVKFIVHICDHSNAVYTQWLKDVPHLVTCHDVMAILSARGLIPGQKTGWTGRLFQNWILSGLKNAAYVICDTEASRSDLLSLAPELENRSTTIGLPLNYPFAPMTREQALAQLGHLPAGSTFQPKEDLFIFHISGNQWYKNREGVIRIFAQLCSSHTDWIQTHPLKLILAGRPPTEAINQLIRSEGLEEKVVFVTAVSDSQVCALYNLAEVLVYPSLKEGFGWPIVEAQACGCSVVTTDRPPMNQIAGPAALLADPENNSTFVAQLFHLLSEVPEDKRSRRENALHHSASFDPKVFAEQMGIIYKNKL